MGAAEMVLSGMWLQDSNVVVAGTNNLLMIFIGIVAFAMLVQAIVIIFVAVGAAQTRKKVMEFMDSFQSKAFPVFDRVGPMVDATHEMIRENAPKIKVVTENLVETSHMVRRKVQEVDATLAEANMRTRAQVARVDGMVSSVLNTTTEVTETIQRGIKVPIREVAGLVNGLKAGLNVLLGRAKGYGSASRAGYPRDVDRGW